MLDGEHTTELPLTSTAMSGFSACPTVRRLPTAITTTPRWNGEPTAIYKIKHCRYNGTHRSRNET